jgi:hypothetical protein
MTMSATPTSMHEDMDRHNAHARISTSTLDCVSGILGASLSPDI